jgi:hypothetical protein
VSVALSLSKGEECRWRAVSWFDKLTTNGNTLDKLTINENTLGRFGTNADVLGTHLHGLQWNL